MAKVKRIVVVSPPDREGCLNPYILACAEKLGIKEIYKVGGAQAIAALAYGTKKILRVNKIVGPGNIYVATAKRIVFGDVDIDFFAGPSEVAILCDSTAKPEFVAGDMISQAEHASDALSLCVTDSWFLAGKVEKEMEKQVKDSARGQILNTSLKNCACVICKNMEIAIEFVNEIAPEHLEILTKKPFLKLDKIKNASAIFLGEDSPVAVGDYIAGPSHVLPTAGSAKFFSPLSVRDFFKVSNIISCDKKGLRQIGPAGIKIAETEGLEAHANSIRLRIKRRKK